MDTSSIWDLGYLASAALFIFGLKYLGSPRTAPRGNQLGALGMLIAVLVTVLKMNSTAEGIVGWPLILGGLVAGGAIGAIMAIRVQMTGMPEMVAILNGFGGGASALVALSEAVRVTFPAEPGESLGRTVFVLAIGASSLIGWVTLSGSFVAMIASASPSTCAPPPMSFFISIMLPADLRSSPPESKHTPLPTRVTLGPFVPQRRSIKRGSRWLARPTAWIIG